ncbi:MAG: TetR/AcrR family transcriptional regulator [Lachnospiraceae bacterium]|nr:TetR/AcrR family transcriptional regulator [Lachnospiraceae bacterium]
MAGEKTDFDTGAFEILPPEKQNFIVDAALRTFGKMGYRKASTGDIAVAAGISKAMVFHYFGNKKNMYLYMMDYVCQMIYAAVEETQKQETVETDFFGRIHIAAMAKMKVMEKQPAIFLFLSNAYFEQDPEVATELKKIFGDGGTYRQQYLFEKSDLKKFKPDVDPELVLKILLKMTEGYIYGVSLDEGFNFAGMVQDFEDSMDLMKRHFYKEEYL